MKRVDPPSVIQRFFHWFCNRLHLEGLEGDLYELFDRRVQNEGGFRARLYYAFDVITLLRPSVMRSFHRNSRTNYMGIFNNYVKTAIRQGWKRKSYSAINLLGLTLGLACVSLIGLYVNDETGYDAYVSEGNSKFRIFNKVEKEGGTTNLLPIVPPLYAPELQATFPQILQTGRIFFDYGGTIFNVGEKVFSEKNGVYAERAAMDILDVELIAGDFSRLGAPKTMLLSASTFQKFFGDAPFDQQTVKLTKSTVQIVGIYKDFPQQSHLRPDYIFSFNWLLDVIPESRMNVWTWQQFFTYVHLKPGTEISQFEALMQTFVGAASREFTEEIGYRYTPFLQNIRDIHLHSSNFQWEIAEVGSYQSILFLSIAAGVILLIAALNFINLTTAQSFTRTREVGVRKFIGANRTQLFLQYGLESVLYCFTAGVLALLIVSISLDPFNQFSGKQFELSEVLAINHLLIFFPGLFILGIAAGWYPALLITSVRPISALHENAGAFGAGYRTSGVNLRQLLVGLQYVLSVGLILISLIMFDQFYFLRNVDMGFDRENLVVMRLTRDMRNDLDATRAAFLSHHSIRNLSFSYGVPGNMVSGDGVVLPKRRSGEFGCNMFVTDPYYLRTLGLELIAGRDFRPELQSDVAEAFIINETAVTNFGLGSPEEAIGEPVKWKMWVSEDTLKVGRVIGVVRDFNYKSLHNPIENVVLHIYPPEFSFMVLRVGSGKEREAIAFLEKQFREIELTRPFEYEFVDQSFAKFYVAEERMAKLFSFFTILAIVTAGIGLFGLVNFTIATRGKELSIRKVLGASTSVIFGLLVRRYFVLMSVCFFIGAPLAYYLSQMWLDDFAYRISISPILFAEVLVATLLLTLVSVGFQALKGALTNPAQRLRAE